MKQTKLSVAIKATLLGTSIALAPAAFAADKELLDILKANGSISQGQYETLLKKADKPSETSALLKKMAWAGKIKIKGDMRVRQENRSVGNSSFSDKDRQRIRARIGVYADVADNVQAGIRLATGGGEATSTNQSLDGGFTEKNAYFDLGYINWQPLEGLEVIGGKFKQPWQKIGKGLVWDGDLNPEGLALRYTTKLGGAKVIGSVGHLVINDIENGSFSDDQTVQFAQLATKFKLAGQKTMLGVSLFDFDEGKNAGSLGSIIGKGNDSTQYSLSELIAETHVDLGLPVKLSGQYVKNNDANGIDSGEDTAWLLGVSTKIGKWKASYDYRDIEKNAVFAAFNDADFADGYADSKGSEWKLAYAIDKNLSIATAYIDAETGNKLNDITKRNANIGTWQIDLKAKF